MNRFVYLLLLACAFFNVNYTQAQNNADQLINEAIEKAKEQDKHVFINYLATSCKLSQKMKKQMEDDTFKLLFNLNYVVVNVEVSDEEKSKYVTCSNPVKTFGSVECKEIEFPFWSILDNEGNYITVSINEGSDSKIGFQSNTEKVNSFIEVAQNYGSKLNEDELYLVSNQLSKMNNQEGL